MIVVPFATERLLPLWISHPRNLSEALAFAESLRRYHEAIALDYIVPFRVITA